MKMSEVISETAVRTYLPIRAVKDVLDTANEVIHEALAGGQEVAVMRLGKIVPRVRAEMVARNIRTGEDVVVPAGRKAGYRPSVSVVAAVNA